MKLISALALPVWAASTFLHYPGYLGSLPPTISWTTSHYLPFHYPSPAFLPPFSPAWFPRLYQESPHFSRHSLKSLGCPPPSRLKTDFSTSCHPETHPPRVRHEFGYDGTSRPPLIIRPNWVVSRPDPAQSPHQGAAAAASLFKDIKLWTQIIARRQNSGNMQ